MYMGLYKTSYLVKLEAAALTPSKSDLAQFLDNAWHYKQARKLHPTSFLKDNGAFFTSDELSKFVATKVIDQIANNYIVFDPACGAGDLLLACAEFLKPSKSLSKTLIHWGNKLAGADINESFVRAAKARLLLLARKLTNDFTDIELSLNELFGKIIVDDGLLTNIPETDQLVIIMNPPFNPMISQKGCKWAEGSITSAAAFFYRYVQDSKDGTRIVAILPEVLRSGSRYEKWRKLVSYNSSEIEKDMLGRFSSFANVDVFALNVKVNKETNNDSFLWWGSKSTNEFKEVIGDLFLVNVGSVVPHRDEELGPIHPYIYPKIIKPWQKIEQVDSFRRYSGRLYKPPFIVLRRTSAPKDDPRCVASIVALSTEVSVENHFLVLTPKDGLLSTCEKCLRSLLNHKTTKWINERIKCRHLTVSSIAELPLWAEEVS